MELKHKQFITDLKYNKIVKILVSKNNFYLKTYNFKVTFFTDNFFTKFITVKIK